MLERLLGRSWRGAGEIFERCGGEILEIYWRDIGKVLERSWRGAREMLTVSRHSDFFSVAM